MKKRLFVLITAAFLFIVPAIGMSDVYNMSYGFISRAAVTDGIIINVGGWGWTWPNIVNGYGINVAGELGNKFLKNLAVGGGASYDAVKWPYYTDSKWSNIGISAYGKYQFFNSEQMRDIIDFLPINVSVLGGVKVNIYTFKINGVKYTWGDDVSGAYYDYYSRAFVVNALGIVDYPLKYVVESGFFHDVIITGYSGILNSSFGGGINMWYAPEGKKFSFKVGWIPLLGLSADFLINL